jgi:hypothetical protein
MFFSCNNHKDLNLEIISKHFNKIGDSIILIDYKNEFDYKIYNCKIKKKPIKITKDIKGFIESDYQIVDDNIVLRSTYFGNGNKKMKDNRVELIKNGILIEFEPYHDDRLDGLLFIFNKKNKFIEVKETSYSEVFGKWSNYFYKTYGITTKDGFTSLPNQFKDSISIKTYQSLWVTYQN